MCRIMEELWQEAAINTQKQIAEKMLQKKIPLKDIVDCTGMSLDDIMALQEEH